MAGIQRDFRQCTKILKKNGFTQLRVNGSHYIYKRGCDEIALQLKPNAMQFQRLIKEYNLKV